MLLLYGGLCVNFDIIGEISHGSNLKHVENIANIALYHSQ